MDYTESIAEVLFVFFVLALIFEIAFTPVFNWRWFILKFDNKGLKTPLVIIVALFFIWGYELDIVNDLLKAMERVPADAENTTWGKVITAFLIAGGSDGFLRLFKHLNIRDPRGRIEDVEKTEKNKTAKKK